MTPAPDTSMSAPTTSLVCPLYLDRADQRRSGPQRSSLDGCVAWIELTADRARALARRVRRVGELEEDDDFDRPFVRDSCPEFDVYDLSAVNDERTDPDGGRVLPLLSGLVDKGSRTPVELAPGYPRPDAELKLNPGFLASRLYVDRGAVLWEVQWCRGSWYHTMAVQDWWLERIARKCEIHVAEGEAQRERFRALVADDESVAVAALEEGVEIARATGGERRVFGSLQREDVLDLLGSRSEEIRRRTLFAMSALDLGGPPTHARREVAR